MVHASPDPEQPFSPVEVISPRKAGHPGKKVKPYKPPDHKNNQS